LRESDIRLQHAVASAEAKSGEAKHVVFCNWGHGEFDKGSEVESFKS
jgi:hypothetical protein